MSEAEQIGDNEEGQSRKQTCCFVKEIPHPDVDAGYQQGKEQCRPKPVRDKLINMRGECRFGDARYDSREGWVGYVVGIPVPHFFDSFILQRFSEIEPEEVLPEFN